MRQRLLEGGGIARQSSGIRTTRARSETAVSPPNDAKPIALATQANGYANTAMLRTSYRNYNATRTLSMPYLTF